MRLIQVPSRLLEALRNFELDSTYLKSESNLGTLKDVLNQQKVKGRR